MWKFLSRIAREALERRVNVSRKDKKPPHECPFTIIQKKLIPGIVTSQRFDYGSSGCKNGPAGCKDGTCGDKEGKQERQHQGERWRSGWCLQQPMLLGALGWSGVLVLGWYLCQPVCRRGHTQPLDLKKLLLCNTKYVNLLSRTVLAQPLSILPNIQELQFGPVTAEEALEEAAEGLARAQDSAKREFENRLGVACMTLGKHTEALTCFKKAVDLGHSPAAFNLGLCYENGLGIAQDLKQAAKYYKMASAWGHATAMYNLGVFHVQGWGGVPRDYGRARQLFAAAAELGQSNARDALAMVSQAQVVCDQVLGMSDVPPELNVGDKMLLVF